MNQFSKQDKSKKFTIILMVLIFVLISNVKGFAQTAVENNIDLDNTLVSNATTEISVAKQEAVSNASNMNFVLWFMGSKQDPNVKISPAGQNTRRQFISSGLAPNRLLIKAFLKKAVNFEVGVA